MCMRAAGAIFLLPFLSLVDCTMVDCGLKTSNLSEEKITDVLARCPSNADCNSLDEFCLDCRCPSNCQYGIDSIAVCTVKESIPCLGNRTINKSFRCQYCFQEPEQFECSENFSCNSVAPRPDDRKYTANCTVHENVLCLGKREYLRKVKCNWTGGSRWSTTLALSITLGGFGADRFVPVVHSHVPVLNVLICRFYLGHWQEGIGKLFSLGGLGVWTLVDVILVGIRWIGPADGSLFV